MASSDCVVGFSSSSGAEADARSALALILNCADNVVISPIDISCSRWVGTNHSGVAVGGHTAGSSVLEGYIDLSIGALADTVTVIVRVRGSASQAVSGKILAVAASAWACCAGGSIVELASWAHNLVSAGRSVPPKVVRAAACSVSVVNEMRWIFACITRSSSAAGGTSRSTVVADVVGDELVTVTGSAAGSGVDWHGVFLADTISIDWGLGE